MVAFGKKLKERQIQEWQGYVFFFCLCVFGLWFHFYACSDAHDFDF